MTSYCSSQSRTIERPSGVSSARLDSNAASASSSISTSCTVMSSVASRLPIVIVPVLSSSSVDTSPAASTARPDMAMTLCCTSRSMPAMPIADSKPPIVVGIRHTSSAISTMICWSACAYIANGCRVATAMKKMIVSPASRIDSAISLGVFWRSAPSTSAIMRSRKVSPGLAVIRTTIWSERTRVPPVTAQRSPPDSRITGADSPVIADSSTDAMPSITSPSDGIGSPADTTHSSPTSSRLDEISSSVPSGRRRCATVSVRALRSAAACALPRPSAIASAKLAKSTVAQRKNVTRAANTFWLVDDVERSRKNKNDV